MPRSPRSALILLTLSVAPFGGCSLLVSENEVERGGVQYFEALKQKEPASTDANLTAYVNCVANDVIAELEPEFSEREWEVVVFDNDEINAFAIAGQKIGVYTGLFKVVQNQDQLATVLGHEVAHVTQKHTLERARRAAATQGGVIFAGAALGGGAAAYDLAGLGAQLGLTLPFSRAAEADADRIGLMYMAEAGFDPRQSVPLWQDMARKNKLGPAEFLSDHPSDSNRVSALIKELPPTLAAYNKAQAAGKKPHCERH